VQVVIGGRNKYLINGVNANNLRVQDLFCSVGLNVNNPHFLIMQVTTIIHPSRNLFGKEWIFVNVLDIRIMNTTGLSFKNECEWLFATYFTCVM